MKIRSFEIEASPAELDASNTLAELLARLAGQPARPPGDGHTLPAENVEADDAAAEQATAEAAETPTPASHDTIPGVPVEGQDTVRALLRRNPAGHVFEEFLAQTTAWPSVTATGIKRKGH